MSWERRWSSIDPVRSQYWSRKATLYWRLFHDDSEVDWEVDVDFDDALGRALERRGLAQTEDELAQVWGESEGSP